MKLGALVGDLVDVLSAIVLFGLLKAGLYEVAAAYAVLQVSLMLRAIIELLTLRNGDIR